MFTNSAVQAVDSGEVHLHSDSSSFEKFFPKVLLDDAFKFSLDEVTKIISSNNTTTTTTTKKTDYKIAVQLSDDSLPFAVHLIKELEDRETARKTEKKDDTNFSLFFFILADNTFAPCCADQVTAQRNNADVIIHFGQTCFSQSIESIPCAFFVPPWKLFSSSSSSIEGKKEPKDNTNVKQVLKTLKAFSLNKTESVAFVFSGGVDKEDVETFKKIVFESIASTNANAETTYENKFSFAICGTQNHELLLQSNNNNNNNNNWNVDGASFPIAEKTGRQVLFFISPSFDSKNDSNVEQNSPLHQLALIEYWNSARRMKYEEENDDNDENDNNEPQVWFTHLTPAATTSRSVANVARDVSRRVNQRMRNVEALSHASSVGLLVMSLSISEHRNLLTKLQTLLRTGGKRAYVVFIGHLNEYKLANFADSIDVFVSLACPNSRPAFFASKDDNFNIPLLFPAEVTLWYERDVKQIPEDTVATKFLSPDLFTTRAGRSMAQVKVVSAPVPAADGAGAAATASSEQLQQQEATSSSSNNDGALIVQAPMHIANPNSNTTGTLAKFQQRAYQGLDPRYGKDDVQEGLVDGLSGIAKSYGTTNQETNGERK